MKYLMFLDDSGARVPLIFPEHLVHAEVAMTTHGMIGGRVISAGFYDAATGDVSGGSESIQLTSEPMDAAYIALGEAVRYMPPAAVSPIWTMYKNRTG